MAMRRPRIMAKANLKALALALAVVGVTPFVAGLDPRWGRALVGLSDRQMHVTSVLAGCIGGLSVALLYTAYQFWRTPPGTYPLTGVPPSEHRQCTRISMQAILLARTGKIAEGYDLLSTALRRAEALRSSDRPWAD